MKNKNLPFLEACIEAGLDLHWKDNCNSTLLHIAYDHRFYEGAEFLIDGGLDLRAANFEGLTPSDFLFSQRYFRNLNQNDLEPFDPSDTAKEIGQILSDTGGIMEIAEYEQATLPTDLIIEALERGPPFLGRPTVIGFEPLGSLLVPVFGWNNDQDESVPSIFSFETPDLEGTVQNFPENRVFDNREEINALFTHLKSQIPHTFTGSGCDARAHWLFRVLRDLLHFNSKVITLGPSGDSEALSPQPPFPPGNWGFHTAAVVSLQNEDGIQEYVFDSLLDQPIPLDQWIALLQCKDPETGAWQESEIQSTEIPSAVPSEEDVSEFFNTMEYLRSFYLFERLSPGMSFDDYELWCEYYNFTRVEFEED